MQNCWLFDVSTYVLICKGWIGVFNAEARGEEPSNLEANRCENASRSNPCRGSLFRPVHRRGYGIAPGYAALPSLISNSIIEYLC